MVLILAVVVAGQLPGIGRANDAPTPLLLFHKETKLLEGETVANDVARHSYRQP